MEFKLLGTLDVALDGRQAALPARAKERCLLAVLLMNAGRTVPAGELIRCVWDDDVPPEGTFRSYLAHVREFLAAAGGGARLVREEGGYKLLVDPDSIDLHRFRGLQERAAAKAKAGNADEAVALLCEAEALWRGPALGGLRGRWVSAIGASLEEERLACVKRRAGLELDLGHHAELRRGAAATVSAVPAGRGSHRLRDDGPVPVRPAGRCSGPLPSGAQPPPRPGHRARARTGGAPPAHPAAGPAAAQDGRPQAARRYGAAARGPPAGRGLRGARRRGRPLPAPGREQRRSP